MQKLILFDIDGTLIKTSALKGVDHWQARVVASIHSVFTVNAVIPDLKTFNGFVDRQLFWYLVRETGVKKSEFEKKYSSLASVFYQKTKDDYEKGHARWNSIADAVDLVKKIKLQNIHNIGVVTGNSEANGWFKLETVGLREFFDFGAFTDTVDDRFKLVELAVKKSKSHFGRSYKGEEIVVVGDTKHDVRTGKSIGAFTIAVTTGLTDTSESLQEENPNLLVDSLMDERVINLLGL